MNRRRASIPECFANADRVTSTRAAFTLLELILVISVLAVMATLSWPRLLSQLKQQTLNGNVEQVRQVLDRARVRAVVEGRLLQVRFEPHGRRYVILPFDPPETDESSSDGRQTTTRIVKTTASEPFRCYTLADQCHFHVDNALLSGESTTVERLDDLRLTELANPADARDVAWSAPILFYADGSASDGSMTVMDRSQRYIKVHVRGLTGGVSVSPAAVMSGKFGVTGN